MIEKGCTCPKRIEPNGYIWVSLGNMNDDCPVWSHGLHPCKSCGEQVRNDAHYVSPVNPFDATVADFDPYRTCELKR